MKDNFPGAVLRDLVYPSALVPALIDTYGTRYPEWLAANPTVASLPVAARLLRTPIAYQAIETLIKYGDTGVLEALFALDEREHGDIIIPRLARAILDHWYLDPKRYWDVDAALGSSGPYASDERRPKSAIIARFKTADGPYRFHRDPSVMLEDPYGFSYHSREQILDAVRDELPRVLGDGDTPHSRDAWLAFINLVLTTPTATLAAMVEVATALTTNE